MQNLTTAIANGKDQQDAIEKATAAGKTQQTATEKATSESKTQLHPKDDDEMDPEEDTYL